MTEPDAMTGWQVAQTIHSLFQYLDDGRFADMAVLFAPDGVWQRQGIALTGPAAVLDAMRARPADLSTRHLVANLIVTGDPQVAHDTEARQKNNEIVAVRNVTRRFR